MRLKQCIFALMAMLLCAFSANAQESVVAKIGNVEYTTFASAMAAANAATEDVTVEVYGAVEFVDGMELDGSYTAITFTGISEEAKITINQTAGGDYLTAHGKTVAFNDLILAKANPAWSGNSGHMGNYFSIQGGTVTYTDCTFPNGACTSTGTAVYNNCTFQNASEYGLWVYDDALVTVNGGTIDSTKGIKVYSEGEDSVTSTLTVQNATFTENVTAKPAVAIGYAESITLIGNTYNNTTGHVELDSGSDADCDGIAFVAQDSEGNDISSELTVVDRSNSSAACGVLVDGKIYTTVAQAADVAAEGSNVTLLYSTTDAVEFAEGVNLTLANGVTADNVTVATSGVAKVGDTTYATLAEAVAAAQAGDEIVLLDDVAEDATLPAGVKFNGNGKAVGNLTAGGEITFTGVTKATSFGVENTNTTVNIVAGACLEITGTGRMVIGHGCTFNITGSIEDAKTADVAALTPSLIIPGASFTGAGVTFNVTNAYISAPSSYCSSSKSASGTFDFNITNSIWESAGKLAFESQSVNATVDFDLKNSVLNTGSHLVFGVSRGEIVIDNSNVNVGTSRQIENQSTMTIKNGAVVNGAVATSSNAKNPGTIIVENATYAVTGEFSGSDLGTGTIIVKKGATVSAGSITKANIQIDATGMAAGDEINLTANLSNLAGSLTVVNNDNLDASIVDGKIVLAVKPVAKIGDVEYTSLEDAFEAAAATAEATITLIEDLTIESDLKDAGKGYFNVADGKKVTLDLGGKTITATDNSTGNFILFYSYGEFTIKNGTVVLTATNDRDWNAQSTIVLNRGGIFNCESGTYTHNGGTDMAFVFDNSGNYYGDATTNIKGGELTSTYIAIRNRMEQNSHGASGKAILNVTGGKINGTSRAIWAQAASTNETAPATGAINVSGGEVGLIDTPRSTGAVSMTTISGGTVAAFKGEAGELTVKGGTIGNVEILTAAGEATDYAITADGVYAQAVAKVGEVKYTDIQEAIKDAAPAGTVELLADVTVDKWIMFTQSLTIGTGQLNTVEKIDGLTINGNNHSLTIKSIESASNGNRLFYDADNLNVKDLTINYVDDAANQGGLGLTAGTIENVTFNGGGNAILPGNGDITVKGCTFKTNGTSIYYEEARDNLVVTGNTFENPDNVNVILLRGNTTFTDNNVISGRTVNVVSGSPVVTRNNFNDVRFKVYNDATATIENNTINTLAFNDESVVNSTFDSNTLSEEAQAVLDAANFPAVAQVGETKYATLEEAFAAAAEGETITLLADATPALTSQRAITKAAVIDLGGNTLTLTEDDLYFGTTTFKNGTIVVDPSVKPSTAVFWMFANQTLTFDAVKVVATGVTGTYLIGLDGDNSDLNLLNGSEILIENTTALDLDVICVNASTGNDIVVENSKVNVTNLDGRVFFRGNYTVKDSEVSLAGITKAGFRIEAGQTLSIEGTSTVTVEGEPRDGGIHITDATATYTKAETATVNATVNAPAPAYVAKIGEQGYATLSAAFAAVTDDAQTVVVLQDVTEELTGAYLRGNITTENGAKVTINLTNSDWVYCPYTFVLGENITLNVPALFYYAGGAQINGAVITDAYYQRNAGTKLTINEPGSLTVTSEMCYIRYTENDANAGIYVNGDNNDETVGLNLSVAYFYQGMIYAKDANIKTSVYWQTNETDGQGSANLVLDNSTLNVTVNEHNFKATGNSTVTLTNGSSIVIAGAFETGSNTEVSVDATSSIIDKNGKVKFGLSGEGTEANPFLISSVDDLVLFRNSVNAGETKYNAEGVYVALGANIDLAGIDWSVNIGDDCAVTFDGIFDGNGLTISNLTATETATKADGYICTGLFGAIYDKAVVKNFTLENVTINAPFVGNNVSAVVGFAYDCKGSIEDVKVVGVNINAPNATGVGAIVGYDYYSPALKVENCIVDKAEITAAAYAGGLVGYASSKIAMNNNTVEDVTVSATASVGAVAGIMLAGGSATDNTVKNVTLTATGTLWANSSAVVAGTITSGAVTVSNTTVENVTANGAAARLVGGILVEKPATEIAKVQAQIGDKFYTTLQTAATAAKENETVTLIADVEATEALNINCALDLNGHSLTATVAPTALPEGYAALPNLDGKFVIGAQPTATVNNLGMTTVAAGDYSIWNGSFDQNTEDDGDMPLSFVMQFLADQDAEDMATSPYADWYGDFVITFTGLENGSFTADGCYLAGHYGSFGWVKVPVDGMTIEEGARYPVMLGVGLGQKYDYICSSVEDFKCALYLTPEILAANPNIQVKLELGVVDNSKGSDAAASALINNENVYSVTEYTYDAEDFVVDPNYIAELTIDDAAGLKYENTVEKTVGTLTYERTLVEGIWNALYLPFKVPVEVLAENYEIAYYNTMHSYDNDNNGVFEEFEMEILKLTTGTLRANYPYFIRPKNSDACSLEIVLEDVTLYPAVEKVITTSSVLHTFKLFGTYKPLSQEELEGYYAINYEGNWSASTGLKPYRLYLSIELNEDEDSSYAAVARSIRIVEGNDGTTGVEEITGENGEDMIFDLQGRRVLEPEKGGLYIINGKKVLVK